MNNQEINQNLLLGVIDKKGVLPHLDQLSELPFIFNQDFGLQALPAEPGMIMIRGPRQYGKSTWLEQKIKETIQAYGAGTALYLNGDEIASHKELTIELKLLINIFPSASKIKRIFIDEITAIVDWQKSLKRLADAGELSDILVVTTGSKAVDLRRDFERMPGRKGRLNRTNYIFTPIAYAEFYEKCSTFFGEDTLYAYILSGGSVIGANSLAMHGMIAEYVVSTVTDWVYGEFAQSGRNRANLMAVLSVLYRLAPNPIGQAKLARESGLSNNTVAKGYIDLLSDLMIVSSAYSYDFDKKIHLFRKESKYHFTNLFFAMCMHPQKPRTIAELKALPTTMLGSILEWLVAQEIWRQSCINNKELDFLSFWQSKEHEIDFVIPENQLCIEVKSGKEQPSNFLWFVKLAHDKQKLMVINQNDFEAKSIKGVNFSDFLLSSLY